MNDSLLLMQNGKLSLGGQDLSDGDELEVMLDGDFSPTRLRLVWPSTWSLEGLHLYGESLHGIRARRVKPDECEVSRSIYLVADRTLFCLHTFLVSLNEARSAALVLDDEAEKDCESALQELRACKDKLQAALENHLAGRGPVEAKSSPNSEVRIETKTEPSNSSTSDSAPGHSPQ